MAIIVSLSGLLLIQNCAINFHFFLFTEKKIVKQLKVIEKIITDHKVYFFFIFRYCRNHMLLNWTFLFSAPVMVFFSGTVRTYWFVFTTTTDESWRKTEQCWVPDWLRYVQKKIFFFFSFLHSLARTWMKWEKKLFCLCLILLMLHIFFAVVSFSDSFYCVWYFSILIVRKPLFMLFTFLVKSVFIWFMVFSLCLIHLVDCIEIYKINSFFTTWPVHCVVISVDWNLGGFNCDSILTITQLWERAWHATVDMQSILCCGVLQLLISKVLILV